MLPYPVAVMDHVLPAARLRSDSPEATLRIGRALGEAAQAGTLLALVGIVDPQQKLAPVLPRKEPVKQRRPHAANVQVTGGTWCEPRANGHGEGWRLEAGGWRRFKPAAAT